VATDINITTDRSTAETSRSRYWYQERSRAADRRCGAPLCLMTYSVQKIAVSRADIGRSLKALDIRTAFSRYLEQLRHYFKKSEEWRKYAVHHYNMKIWITIYVKATVYVL
jgi:hypothetical protein